MSTREVARYYEVEQFLRGERGGDFFWTDRRRYLTSELRFAEADALSRKVAVRGRDVLTEVRLTEVVAMRGERDDYEADADRYFIDGTEVERDSDRFKRIASETSRRSRT